MNKIDSYLIENVLICIPIEEYNMLNNNKIKSDIIINNLLNECSLSNNNEDLDAYGIYTTLDLVKTLFNYKYLNKVEELQNSYKEN